MQQIHLLLAERRREFDANGDAITSVRRRITDLTEQLEELGDAKSRVDALPAVPAQTASPELDASSKQRVRNESEKRAAERIVATLASLKERVTTAAVTARSELERPVTESGSLNDGIGRRIAEVAAAFTTDLAPLIEELARLVTGAVSASCGVARGTSGRARRPRGRTHAATAAEPSGGTSIRGPHGGRAGLAAVADLRLQREQAEADLARLHDARQTLKADYFLTARPRVRGTGAGRGEPSTQHRRARPHPGPAQRRLAGVPGEVVGRTERIEPAQPERVARTTRRRSAGGHGPDPARTTTRQNWKPKPRSAGNDAGKW